MTLLGERFRDWSRVTGGTQEIIAGRLGVTPSAVCQLLGKRSRSWSSVERLLDAMGLPEADRWQFEEAARLDNSPQEVVDLVETLRAEHSAVVGDAATAEVDSLATVTRAGALVVEVTEALADGKIDTDEATSLLGGITALEHRLARCKADLIARLDLERQEVAG